MAAAKSTRGTGAGERPRRSNPTGRQRSEAPSVVAKGQPPATSASTTRRVSPGASGGTGPERWGPLSLSELHQSLASTVKKIGEYNEEVLRLRTNVSKQVKKRDRVLVEYKVPSLEQVIVESSERRVDPSLLQQFQMSETSRAYTGPEGDRKAILSHRQEMQTHARELGRGKEAFLQEIRARAILARNERLAERIEAENAVIATRNDLKASEAKLHSYEEDKASLMEAIAYACKGGRTLSAAPVGSRSRTERRKLVDDALLTDSRAFRYHPSWLDVEQSARKIKLLKISDNLLLVGSKAFGTKVPPIDELERMVSDMVNHEGGSGRLRAIYQSLIKLLIVDDVESKVGTARAYWIVLMSAGCWPEILRRFILLRKLGDDTPDYQRPDRKVSMAAGLLARDNIESLTLDQHILILHYLGDTVMVDSTVFRDAVATREQENWEMRREIQHIARESSSEARDARIREIEMQMMENPDNMRPIGIDRYHRRYWWGLGGAKSDILVEDTDEFVALVTSKDALTELLESLDVRGEREERLQKNILAIKDTMIRAIEHSNKKNASEQDELTDDKGAQTHPVRQSSRQTRQAEFYDPVTATSKTGAGSRVRERPGELSDRQLVAQLSTIDQDLPASVVTAMVDTALILADLGSQAARLGIPCGTNSSWQLFHKMVTTFGFSYGSEEYRRVTVEHITETLRSQMCFMEEVLNGQSRSLQGVKDKRDAHNPGLDEVHVLAPPAPRHRPRTSIYLWNTMKERASWLNDVTISSHSASSRLNYAARVLHMRATPLLAKLATGI